MDKVFIPENFSTEEFKPGDASKWTNATLLDALNQIVSFIGESEKVSYSDFDSFIAGRNYRIVTNEIRRRMQANVENFTLLEVEHYYPVNRETGRIEDEEEMPEKYDSVSHAWAGLEILADDDDNIVFTGVSPEDYYRTWNRMVDRMKKGLFYYEDESDEENMRIS